VSMVRIARMRNAGVKAYILGTTRTRIHCKNAPIRSDVDRLKSN
jgi:hypothetical protein